MKITPSEIILDRKLSDLDKFAITFSNTIGKKIPYLIVSGYVSILLGRARASEDIDMIVPQMNAAEWKDVYEYLVKSGYYCLNADAEEAYNILQDGMAVRFAPVGIVIPNMEILFALNKTQQLALSTRIKVKIGKKEIFISNLELQIAYKEIVLKSLKDLEDAKHLRILLGKDLNMKKLREYKRLVK